MKVMCRLILQKTFDHKQERNEKQKSYQNLVNAFIMCAVECRISAVNPNGARDKNQKKYNCKNDLACGKHVYSILAKVKYLLRVCAKFGKKNTMKKQLDSVRDFHQAFGLTVNDSPIADLGSSINMLRFNLMKEENEEYLEAVLNNDTVEVADALGDMLYILCGTIISHGLQHKIEEVFDEIQRSNMSKLGVDGKPIYREDGKVLKGPNFSKPDFSAILG